MDRRWMLGALLLIAAGGRVAWSEEKTADRRHTIAVTGQGDGTWLIDDNDRPVAPALLWLDSRAAPIVEEIRASERNAALYRRTGSGLNACQQGPQLA